MKLNGYCFAGRNSIGVTLWSQARKPFHKPIPADQPKPASGSRRAPVLDGKTVTVDANGRVVFNLLQQWTVPEMWLSACVGCWFQSFLNLVGEYALS